MAYDTHTDTSITGLVRGAMDDARETGLAIVGVLLALVAGVMFLMGRAAVRRVRPLPRTVESLKENFR